MIEATETIIWKHSSQMTEVILAIEMILVYGSSEIDSSYSFSTLDYNVLQDLQTTQAWTAAFVTQFRLLIHFILAAGCSSLMPEESLTV